MSRLFAHRVCSPLLKEWRRAARDLRRDERGAVAVWVGIALIVFIGCAGIAVDTARGYMLKARLSQALDAAALAGAKSIGTGHVKEDITMFFNANFPAGELDAVVTGPILEPADPDSPENTSSSIKVSASATTQTTLMTVLGFNDMTVSASATAVRGLQGLDVVISIDVSGSMCEPGTTCGKIIAAQKAAKLLINTVYGDEESPKVITIQGTPYNLLNIGLVPWTSKVNVTYNKASSKYVAYTKADKVPVAQFFNPVTGDSQDFYWKANNSEVRLLNDPGKNWKGGVYARYIDNKGAQNANDDADMKLGYISTGGKSWYGYEAVPTLEGEPVDRKVALDGADISAAPVNALDSWDATTGGKYPPTGATTTNWYSSTPNKTRNCYAAYFNDSLIDSKNHPVNVPNTPTWWVPGYTASNPTAFTTAGNSECSPTPQQGIFPLSPVTNATEKATMESAVDQLYTGKVLEGGTNAEQGLYWAWEVLMPGAPFDDAKASVPFNRTQAIVILTDGESTGWNGDAYKGVFGSNLDANKNTGHGSLIAGVKKCPPYQGTNFTVNNNLNGRLYGLAKNIKGSDPEKGVKIFVVQYQATDATLTDLLQLVASKCTAPYYFQAGSDAALEDAFKKIATELSVLRLEK